MWGILGSRAPNALSYDAMVEAVPSLLLYWKLDETTGTAAHNSSAGGSAYDGGYLGTFTLDAPPIVRGTSGCLELAGTGGGGGSSIPPGSGMVGSNSLIGPAVTRANNFTMSAWVEIAAYSTVDAYAICGSQQYFTGAAGGPVLNINGTGHLELDAAFTALISTSTVVVPLNQKCFVAVTVDAANLCTFYINGAPAGAATVSTASLIPYGGFFVGASKSQESFNDLNKFFGGLVSRVATFGAALSAQELAAQYLAGR